MLVVVAIASFKPQSAPAVVVHVNVANHEVRAPLHPESETRGVSNHQVLDNDVGL